MILKWIMICASVIKSWFKKEEIVEPVTIANLLQLLRAIEIRCKEGNPTTHDLESLLNIADNIPESPSISLFKDKSTIVSFSSITSQGLLEAVSKKYYAKQTIVRSYLISVHPLQRPFNEWWSNDESIYYFLLFMKEMVGNQLLLLKDSKARIESEKEEFLDSYLYRILIVDYINLVELILMELNTDENKK